MTTANTTINIAALFEQGARQKWRFDTPKGAIAIEDLWDLPLTSATGKANLDDIAKGLYRKVKADTDEPTSFVAAALAASVKVDTVTPAKLEIVKHVISVIAVENTEARNRAAKAAAKQELMALIEAKQKDAVAALPLEELLKRLEALG